MIIYIFLPIAYTFASYLKLYILVTFRLNYTILNITALTSITLSYPCYNVHFQPGFGRATGKTHIATFHFNIRDKAEVLQY